MAGLTLDAGAVIACQRRDRRFQVIWTAALGQKARVTIPAAVLAQTWRGNDALIARLMQACIIEPLDEGRAKEIGLLLACMTKPRTRPDIVDATVVLGAVGRGDAIVTSDPDDIGRLVTAARATVRVLRV